MRPKEAARLMTTAAVYARLAKDQAKFVEGGRAPGGGSRSEKAEFVNFLSKVAGLVDQPGVLVDQVAGLIDQPTALLDQTGVLVDQPAGLID